ncbi:MAG TPA: P-loop NTPase fold protein, partial [Nitrospira sp.]|nr:P-loop NTPase fold protein [Nitrospira sp.]
MRIGIFGRWGEGKTTVLNYVEQMARTDGFPVAKFNPWAAQNREELWESLVLAIESAFKKGNLTKTKLKSKATKVIKSDGVGKVLKKGLNLAGPGLGEVAEAIGGLLGPLMQDQLRVSQNDAEQVIKQNLGDQKLIILVDDLDRANPELVPHLLMGLREILDLPQCVFMMGLDPVIVSNALSDVHAEWGKTPEFLEKIIDFPFWLPPVHNEDIRCLLGQELKDSPINIDEHALAEVVHLLPTNPRKLKRFLRGLWRFKAQIERHEEPETEWIFLLLIELLRTVSNKAAERLLGNKELWDELQTSRFKGKLKEIDGEEAIEEERWVSIMNSVVNQEHDKEGSLLETERAELLRIMNAMRDLISIEKWQNLHYWARLQDNPPIFTWKEFKRLFEQWKANPTKVFLEKLIQNHAVQIETERDIVARDLFGMTIVHREQLLAEAAESGPESELIETVKVS